MVIGSNVASPGGSRNRWKRRLVGQGGGILGRGRGRRRGMWWDRVYKRIAVEGKDFVQDSQDGVGNEFELLCDSDEVSIEFVPEMEVQDIGVGGGIGESDQLVSEHPLKSMLQDCCQVVLGEDSKESNPLVPENEKDEQAKGSSNKSTPEVSIADAETDDEGITTWYDDDGMDLRGQSQGEDDSKLTDLKTDMLLTMIPAYGKVRKRSSP